MTAGKRRKYKG